MKKIGILICMLSVSACATYQPKCNETWGCAQTWEQARTQMKVDEIMNDVHNYETTHAPVNP